MTEKKMMQQIYETVSESITCSMSTKLATNALSSHALNAHPLIVVKVSLGYKIRMDKLQLNKHHYFPKMMLK